MKNSNYAKIHVIAWRAIWIIPLWITVGILYVLLVCAYGKYKADTAMHNLL